MDNRRGGYYRYNAPVHFTDKKNFKYKCFVDDKRLTAGGIFFYEEINGKKGLWLLKEDDYTDFGGKYDYNDGDIYATISREFREEVLNTQEISYKDIKSIPANHHIYINGYDAHPVYLCVIVHIDRFNIKLDSDLIRTEKQKVLKANPKVPRDWYKTEDVNFVYLDHIQRGGVIISRRLRSILTTLTTNLNNYSEEIQTFFKRFTL